jgi:Mn2+/Fe2+ NRAMP family transporter
MPVTCIMGVTATMTVVMTIVLMMRTIVRVEIVQSDCVVMMVVAVLTVFGLVNVDMRGVVSGMTVPKRGTGRCG